MQSFLKYNPLSLSLTSVFPSTPLLIFSFLTPSLSLSLFPFPSLSLLHFFCFGSVESCKTKARIFVLYDLKIENWVCANVEFRYFSTFNSPFVGGSRFNASSYLPADKVSIVTKIKNCYMVYVNNMWKVQHNYYHQPLTFVFPGTGKYFQYALKKNYGGWLAYYWYQQVEMITAVFIR